MANQYTSEKKTLGELLSMTSPPIEVPDFQRNFSWNTSAVETFWQDVTTFSDQYPGNNITDQEYFLGSAVMVNTGAKHLLLDGQQRLATATVLLSIVRDYLTRYSADAGTRTAQKYITDFDDATDTHAFKLTLNRYDRDFFKREIQEARTAEYTSPIAEIASHKLIRQAREYFLRRFDKKYEQLGGGKDAFEWSLRVRRVLVDHVSVVAVSSADEDNASTVFETLNDRGIGLSTPDLLRMLLLRRAGEPEREEVIDCWHDVLEMEEDAKVDDFLRHYWLSHRGDVKTRSLYREMKGTIIREDTDSLTLSRDLSQTATVYRDIVASRDEDHDMRRLLTSINMLGAKSLMPSILSGYAVGSVEQRKAFLAALITLFVRHSVIGNLENSRLETVVFNNREGCTRWERLGRGNSASERICSFS